jgi:hypothetical protein
MIKYEYLEEIEESGIDKPINLNNYGKDGWELITIFTTNTNYTTLIYYTFKRPLIT